MVCRDCQFLSQNRPTLGKIIGMVRISVTRAILFGLVLAVLVSFQNCAPENPDRVGVSSSSSKGEEAAAQHDIQILSAPKNATAYVGYPLFLRVQAVSKSNAPLSYQWFRSGVEISGANSDSLNIASANTDVQGILRCRIRSGVDEISVSANVQVENPPTIVFQSHPTSTGVILGSSATLSALVSSSSGTLSYQWYKNSQPISGATASQLVLSNVTANDSATYYLVASVGPISVRSENSQVGIRLDVSGVTGCVNGYCACSNNANTVLGTQSVDQLVLAICNLKGYASVMGFLTANVGSRTRHCNANGSSCYTSFDTITNPVCSEVTCVK